MIYELIFFVGELKEFFGDKNIPVLLFPAPKNPKDKDIEFYNAFQIENQGFEYLGVFTKDNVEISYPISFKEGDVL